MAKKICEIECSFEKSKRNLSFDIQDQTGYINLVADGTQIANVANLLLLAGHGKTFKVVFYEGKDQTKKTRPPRL